MENKNIARIVAFLSFIILFSGCVEILFPQQTTTLTTSETTTSTETTEVITSTTEIITTPFTTTTLSCNDICVEMDYSNGFCLDVCEEKFIDVGNEGCDPEKECCCFVWDFVTTIIATSTTSKCSVKCCSHSDCGERIVTHNYTCDTNIFYRAYIDPFCKYAATPSAQCIGRAKKEILRSCDLELEKCVEDEPYCAFISEGTYVILEAPRNAQIFTATDSGLSGYDIYQFKIKYVISSKTEPDGLCLYVKNPDLTIARFYLTDKYGQWLDNKTRIGVSKIFIYSSAISAEMWGMKTK